MGTLGDSGVVFSNDPGQLRVGSVSVSFTLGLFSNFAVSSDFSCILVETSNLSSSSGLMRHLQLQTSKKHKV